MPPKRGRGIDLHSRSGCVTPEDHTLAHGLCRWNLRDDLEFTTARAIKGHHRIPDRQPIRFTNQLLAVEVVAVNTLVDLDNDCLRFRKGVISHLTTHIHLVYRCNDLTWHLMLRDLHTELWLIVPSNFARACKHPLVVQERHPLRASVLEASATPLLLPVWQKVCGMHGPLILIWQAFREGIQPMQGRRRWGHWPTRRHPSQWHHGRTQWIHHVIHWDI
mmetsp:Transcript_75966/g.180682  ORF Transcript_75966/g.180682 Transcript_75966/m.180682 type:complete len:219 (+) Transcript_75966:282-938(+)